MDALTITRMEQCIAYLQYLQLSRNDFYTIQMMNVKFTSVVWYILYPLFLHRHLRLTVL